MTDNCAAEVSFKTTGDGPADEPLKSPCAAPHALSIISAIPLAATERQRIATASCSNIRLLYQTPRSAAG
jgi:hypothetical protein